MVETRKGALVRLADLRSQGRRRGLVFQYNPEELYRRIDVQSGAAPSEIISCTLFFDATDQRTEFHLGDVHSSLAALEVLAKPTPVPDPTGFFTRLFGAPIVPKPPILLFVYGQTRRIPVRITRLDITEQTHDPALRVVRARVKLAMTVVTESDVPNDHPDATVLRSVESDKRERAAAVFEDFPRDVV